MPMLRRQGRFGDLRVVANVVIPRRLTGEQRKALEAFAETVTPEQLRADDDTMVGKLRRLFHR